MLFSHHFRCCAIETLSEREFILSLDRGSYIIDLDRVTERQLAKRAREMLANYKGNGKNIVAVHAFNYEGVCVGTWTNGEIND